MGSFDVITKLWAWLLVFGVGLLDPRAAASDNAPWKELLEVAPPPAPPWIHAYSEVEPGPRLSRAQILRHEVPFFRPEIDPRIFWVTTPEDNQRIESGLRRLLEDWYRTHQRIGVRVPASIRLEIQLTWAQSVEQTEPEWTFLRVTGSSWPPNPESITHFLGHPWIRTPEMVGVRTPQVVANPSLRSIFDPLYDGGSLYAKPQALNLRLMVAPDPSSPLSKDAVFFDGSRVQSAADLMLFEGQARARVAQLAAEGKSYYSQRVIRPLSLHGFDIFWQRSLLIERVDDDRLLTVFLGPGHVVGRRDGATIRWQAGLAPPLPVDKANEDESTSSPRDSSAMGGDKSGITWTDTIGRGFEEGYWAHIAELTRMVGGRNAADSAHLRNRALSLLKSYYRSQGLAVHEHAFPWRTLFSFSKWLGWLEGQSHDQALWPRNLIVPIEGKRSDRVLILADHVDTAYMEDHWNQTGSRLAAPGADDNASATSALMMAAPALRRLSLEGRLKDSIWLVHLAGEEFPSDCLGARALVSDLLNGRRILPDRPNPATVRAMVLDMIAHSTTLDRALAQGPVLQPVVHALQLASGRGEDARRLATLAERVVTQWNRETAAWNLQERRPPEVTMDRIEVPPGPQPPLPPIMTYARLRADHRPTQHPRSTLYNTDGQIFSDAGIPTLLWMEDYEIDRVGYHDSRDDLSSIDLSYGAAVARVAIEVAARASGALAATARPTAASQSD